MATRARSGRKTDYEWVATAGSVHGTDLPVITAVLGPGVISFTDSGTVFRVRGRVWVQLDAGAVDEDVLICVGIGITISRSLAQGMTSVPWPHSDRKAKGWLWTGYLWASALAQTGVATQFFADRMLVDTKAMRKVTAENQIYVAAEVANVLDATGTWDFGYGFAALLGS